MDNFEGRIAVVTGGGDAVGREVARQLGGLGCNVAIGDFNKDGAFETKRLCDASAPTGTRVTTHSCDVSLEGDVLAFRDAVLAEHRTDHINLLFNNAGIVGGLSFVKDPRDEWERTFDVS